MTFSGVNAVALREKAGTASPTIWFEDDHGWSSIVNHNFMDPRDLWMLKGAAPAMDSDVICRFVAGSLSLFSDFGHPLGKEEFEHGKRNPSQTGMNKTL